MRSDSDNRKRPHSPHAGSPDVVLAKKPKTGIASTSPLLRVGTDRIGRQLSPTGSAGSDAAARGAVHANSRSSPNRSSSVHLDTTAIAAPGLRCTLPWLRSGRQFTHPLVVESATIEVQSMSEFQLAPPESVASTRAAMSSQPTITEVASPATLSSSQGTTDAGNSFFATSSQTSTIAPPWTPSPSPSPPQRRYRYTGSQPVDTWYAEVYESDGYDSEALALIATPPRRLPGMATPPRRAVLIASPVNRSRGAATPSSTSSTPRPAPRNSSPRLDLGTGNFSSGSPSGLPTGRTVAPPLPSRNISSLPAERRASAASSITSSQGYLIIRDTALDNASDLWRPEAWPSDVEFLGAHYNPKKWKFSEVDDGVRGGMGCGCSDRCNAISCRNARNGRFCAEYNCSFAGECGNSLRESPFLAISRNARTGMRGLTATGPIPAGQIIGQYFGHLKLFGPHRRNGPPNEGYRVQLKTRSSGGKYLGIDALHCGGKLRLMNHSCNPAARFHEVQTGSELTIVAVTIRDVYPGEEVTVSYGNQLWFLCRCGWWGCQHRDIQDLPAFIATPWVGS